MANNFLAGLSGGLQGFQATDPFGSRSQGAQAIGTKLRTMQYSPDEMMIWNAKGEVVGEENSLDFASNMLKEFTTGNISPEIALQLMGEDNRWSNRPFGKKLMLEGLNMLSAPDLQDMSPKEQHDTLTSIANMILKYWKVSAGHKQPTGEAAKQIAPAFEARYKGEYQAEPTPTPLRWGEFDPSQRKSWAEARGLPGGKLPGTVGQAVEAKMAGGKMPTPSTKAHQEWLQTRKKQFSSLNDDGKIVVAFLASGLPAAEQEAERQGKHRNDIEELMTETYRVMSSDAFKAQIAGGKDWRDYDARDLESGEIEGYLKSQVWLVTESDLPDEWVQWTLNNWDYGRAVAILETKGVENMPWERERTWSQWPTFQRR